MEILHGIRETILVHSPLHVVLTPRREIKQNLWDTVLFFQKGKFFELYENDATIGQQQFDLKLTDRTNMRY